MSSIKFILQQPYKKSENPDPVIAKIENQQIRDEVTKRRREKRPLSPFLNSKPTRLYLWLIQSRDNKAKIRTDLTIYPKDWDFTQQQAKKSMIGSTEYNQRILNLRMKVQAYYNRLMDDNPGINFAEVSELIKDLISKNHTPVAKEERTFFAVFDQFLEAEKQIKSFRTIQKFTTLKNSLEVFSKTHYPKGLSFDDIDFSFYDQYTNYLRSQPPRGRQKSRPEEMQEGVQDSTLEKYISSFKTFMRWSMKRGFHKNMVFNDMEFVAKRDKENGIITLTPAELETFWNYDFSNNPRFDRVRDLFCFGCFTAARWSDIQAFNKDDVKGDVWTFESYKSKKEIVIPLIGFAAPALKILKKYNFVLPRLSGQKFNEALKEAASIAGINTPVTMKRSIGSRQIIIERPKCKFMSSHTARRTCITILLNYEYLPVTLVQQITGHTKLTTLQKYINQERDALRTALEKTRNYNF